MIICADNLMLVSVVFVCMYLGTMDCVVCKNVDSLPKHEPCQYKWWAIWALVLVLDIWLYGASKNLCELILSSSLCGVDFDNQLSDWNHHKTKTGGFPLLFLMVASLCAWTLNLVINSVVFEEASWAGRNPNTQICPLMWFSSNSRAGYGAG